LQSRYKDYKYIKNIIKSRRIDLRDKTDITEIELHPEDNELNSSDFSKFTNYKNIYEPEKKEFNKIEHELFRKIDIEDYKSWYAEYSRKKDI